MGLPKINENYYSCTLPTNQKKVNFRPFNVKEQKKFLMEVENNNNVGTKYKFIYDMVKQCCSEDIDDLYTVDFDYLFFQIRKYSIGTKIELNFKYKKEDENIEEKVETDIDIDNDIKITPIEEDFFKLSFKYQDMTINMKQIKVKNFVDSYDIKEDKEGYLIATMLKSVEKKENGEPKLYNDFILKDAKDFLENLPNKEYEKIVDFLKKNPKLIFDKKIRLKCGKELDLSKFNYMDFFLSR